MPQLLWDASSSLKRYGSEAGSDTVDALFAVQPALPMLITYLGYAETSAILLRKLNQGALSLPEFVEAHVNGMGDQLSVINGFC